MRFKVGDEVIGVDILSTEGVYKFRDSGLVEGQVYIVKEIRPSLVKVESSDNWHDCRRFVLATELTKELI